jgi:hypothetical protein
MSRLRGEHLELKPSLIKRGQAYSQTARNFPVTPIVKGLVIRRAAPRLIALQSLGKVLRESFVALESFSYLTYMARTGDQERDFVEGKTPCYPTIELTGADKLRSFYTAITFLAYNAEAIQLQQEASHWIMQSSHQPRSLLITPLRPNMSPLHRIPCTPRSQPQSILRRNHSLRKV